LILIDPRRGSGELENRFRRMGLKQDVEVEVRDLDAGDFAFWGNGPEDIVLVGFERKIISDFFQSMRSHRLSGFQIPEMVKMYDLSFLIVEGEYRIGKGGALTVPRFNKRMKRTEYRALKAGGESAVVYGEMAGHRASISMFTPLRVERTYGEIETVALVMSWYKWFQKDWGQHRSHEAIYAPYTAPDAMGRSHRGSFIPRKVSVLEKMIAQLPGIGARAQDIANYFGTDVPVDVAFEKALAAGVEEWTEIPVVIRGKDGRKKGRLGPKRAENVWKELHV